MSYRTRAGTVFVLAMAVLLFATACSRSPRPTTDAEGPSTSASPASSDDPTSASESTQIDASPGTDGQPHNTPKPNSSPPPNPVPNVTVKFTSKNGSEVYSQNCPFTYAVYATITVTGPIDLTYQFFHGKAPYLSPATPLHFAAAGSKVVTGSIQVLVGGPTAFEDTVVVKGPGGLAYQDGSVFTLACIPRAGAVTASPAKSTCPYLTTFSVTVSVPLGPQTSQYTWIFEDGSKLAGTLTFPTTGAQSQVVTVKRKVQLGSTGVSATFLPNEHSIPNGTPPATATCF
jgi:hypothetical protein